MSKVKKYKFSKLYDFSSGISSKPEQAGHGTPFLSFSTIFNNYFIPNKLPDLMDSSLDSQKKYSIKNGDIFLTRTSEVIDELGISCVAVKDYPKATYSGFAKRLRPLQTDVTYSKFMAFYLRSKLFRKTMTNNAVLTLRASLNEQIFSYLDLLLPRYNQQVKIGDFLYLLNSKIELNNRINAELEAMAKTLYDYWFVQFDFPNENGKPYKSSGGKMVFSEELKREIPEGWEVKKINSKIKIGSGYPFKTEHYDNNGKYKIITIKSVQEGNLDTSKADKIDFIPDNLPDFCKLKKGDVLMSLTGNVGRMCFIDRDNLLLNQRVGKLLADKNFVYYGYLYFNRQESQKRLKKIANGSSQSNLSPVDAVKDYFVAPEESILENFSRTTNPIFKKMLKIQEENQKLSELRDWLLPMLMNGQVKVK
ncbi:MAG: restriction endonuclease subunit S [Dehalococcoidia bacterium]|nr:MAG: restriction endonuclease subunit S [Dehalococcoidia bacterium]